MDKNFGHFNPQILEQFRNMVYGSTNRIPEAKVEKRQILALIDDFIKKGLTKSDISEAYHYTKDEIGGSIVSWHDLRAFEKNLEKILEYQNTPTEEKPIGKKEVDYLVGLIKPLHYRNQIKLPQETKLGYIRPEALEKYQEDASQPGSRRACRKPNGDVYRIPLNRQCQQGEEIPDPGPVSRGRSRNQDQNNTRRRGRGRSGRTGRSSQSRSSIIQSLKGKLDGGGGKLDIRPIGGGGR